MTNQDLSPIFVKCEERTSKGTETKHGQSSVPFLTLNTVLAHTSIQKFQYGPGPVALFEPASDTLHLILDRVNGYPFGLRGCSTVRSSHCKLFTHTNFLPKLRTIFGRYFLGAFVLAYRL